MFTTVSCMCWSRPWTQTAKFTSWLQSEAPGRFLFCCSSSCSSSSQLFFYFFIFLFFYFFIFLFSFDGFKKKLEADGSFSVEVHTRYSEAVWRKHEAFLSSDQHYSADVHYPLLMILSWATSGEHQERTSKKQKTSSWKKKNRMKSWKYLSSHATTKKRGEE